ncbi:MAG: outer membrane beta-barrel protein [Steroidobacteraceae bacterium]|nr:outer membrane beta-barrel protein [Steroidobacteraceae bacterium]
MTFALAFSGAAMAADPEAALSRLDAATPEYFENLGVRAGPLTLSGAGGIALGYDSNVYASEESQDSALSRAQLALRLDHESRGREFAALLFGEARRYEDAEDQNASEFGAATRYTAIATSHDEMELWLSGQRRVERRTEIETPLALARSRFDEARVGARHVHTFNRLSLGARVEAQRLEYAADSQSFRDRDSYRGELRTAYAMSSELSGFLSFAFNRDEFDTNSSLVSADTASALLGVRIELNELLDLELGAGAFERRFDGSREPLTGVLVRGALEWQPTRLSRVRAELLRSDEPTAVPGAFGKIRNELAFELAHDFSRSVALFAGARGVLDEFDTGSSDATLWSAEAGASWSIGRRSSLRFSYGYGSRSADTLDRDFVRHVASISFVGRL